MRDMPGDTHSVLLGRQLQARRRATSPATSSPSRTRSRPSRSPARCCSPSGRTVSKTLDGLSFLATVLDSDLNPGLAAELPAVTHAARNREHAAAPPARVPARRRLGDAVDRSQRRALRGDRLPRRAVPVVAGHGDRAPARRSSTPRSRLSRPGRSGRSERGRTASATPTSASAGRRRPAALRSAPARCPTSRCSRSAAATTCGRRPRAPPRSCHASRRGELLVVPGVGHSTVTADPSGCAIQSLRLWMTGGTPPAQCPRSLPILPPIPALPAGKVPAKPWSALTTYSIASKTIAEAEASWIGSSVVAGARHLRRQARRRAAPVHPHPLRDRAGCGPQRARSG